jgi:hypothetical protein
LENNHFRTGALRALVAIAFLASAGVVSQPLASAQPIGFPDLTRFTDADAGHYTRPFSYAERWSSGYLFFTTPDGINCAIGGSSWCTGDFPGRPDDPGACDSVQRDGDAATRSFAFGSNYGHCIPTTDALLASGQKLTNAAFGTTCVVGEGRLTACIQNDHGFVLQPSGSWVF